MELDDTFMYDSFVLTQKGGDVLDRNRFGKGAKRVVQDARETILLRARAGQRRRMVYVKANNASFAFRILSQTASLCCGRSV
jgi:streptomycin 6-kinase